jgi:hypothetical protein
VCRHCSSCFYVIVEKFDIFVEVNAYEMREALKSIIGLCGDYPIKKIKTPG